MVRIYQAGVYQTGQLLTLSPEASQHVGVVLRMHVGEELTLFCGDNREFQATIESVKKKQVVVVIGAIQNKNCESPLIIHLAQAISKGERMELVMQKAVELGASSIIPLITERCVVKLDKERMAKKHQQWHSIIISACEQSGRNTLPMLYDPIPFDRYIQNAKAELRFILHPGENKRCRDYSIECTSVDLLIGPEGGFSDNEVRFAKEHGFQALSLGPRILRTETAAITALSILQSAGGDL